MLTDELTDLSDADTTNSFKAHAVTDSAPAFDKTGTHLWFIRDGKRLMVTDVGGGAPKDAGPAADCSTEVCWGSFVIDSAASAVYNKGLLYPYSEFAQNSNPAGTMAILHDGSGNFIAYKNGTTMSTKAMSEDSLLGYGRASDGYRLLMDDDDLPICAWTDNSHLVCIADGEGSKKTSRLAVVDTNNPTKMTYITDATESEIKTVAVSPDRKTVVFKTTRSEQDELYTVPVSGGEPTEVGSLNSDLGRIVAWN